ncbi:hypothetical protein G9401_00315 [Weissella paramesenteroides]|uniref:hypothetical protein n=1 Tax=Weissella paramesenteroides TaxID=1249 RepID=UPI0023F7D721|nr:hypothetical protein [Weissella paramesenteroides]MDF8374038.1 hypothetical protein [Weissella paramesenteroides]
MTDKAYIVANEQQECEVLEKLEREGYLWRGTDMRPTEKHRLIDEPITIFARDDKRLVFDSGVNEAYLADYEIEIDFDGRKEEQMSEKYVVSQEFMNELEEWKKRGNTELYFVGSYGLSMLPDYVKRWWNYPEINNFECNNRLIAIIRWVNGEDVFEVEKPKKWVVRSKECDEGGNYQYIKVGNFNMSFNKYEFKNATKFDTKEEAESWANAHQEVVEVVDV